MNNIEKLDVVALLQNIPEENLSRGDIGTVLEVLDQGVYLLEYCDKNGKTIKTLEIKEDSLMKINYLLESELV